MRVAALYDVHGNLPALEAVLADSAAAGVDEIVVGRRRRSGGRSSSSASSASRPSGRVRFARQLRAQRPRARRATPTAGATTQLDAGARSFVAHVASRRSSSTSTARPRRLLSRDADGRRDDPDDAHARRGRPRRARRDERRRRRLRPHARPVRPRRRRRAAARQCRQRRPAVRGPAGRVLGAPRRRRRAASQPTYDVESALDAARARRASRRSTISFRDVASWRDDAPRRRRRTSRAGAWRVATSREARRRGLGTRRERIGPIVERLAAEHADATIALRFRTDLELLVSVMLSAQTTDVNVNRVTEGALPQVPAPRGLPRRARRGARAGHLRDRASSGRRRSRSAARCACSSRSSTGRCRARLAELLRLPGVARKTANVVAAELGHAAGHRRRHPRAAALAAARADAAGGSGQDRARPAARRPARRLGDGSRTC